MIQPSDKYRSMIYFVTATIHLYSKTVKHDNEMTVSEFMSQNKDIMDRVFEECKTVFNYELSSEQMGRGAYAYLAGHYSAQSVYETEVFKAKR